MLNLHEELPTSLFESLTDRQKFIFQYGYSNCSTRRLKSIEQLITIMESPELGSIIKDKSLPGNIVLTASYYGDYFIFGSDDLPFTKDCFEDSIKTFTPEELSLYFRNVVEPNITPDLLDKLDLEDISIEYRALKNMPIVCSGIRIDYSTYSYMYNSLGNWIHHVNEELITHNELIEQCEKILDAEVDFESI